MDQADFVHLVRLSEQDSAEDARAYRRKVAAFAALGYAWVLGWFVLAAGLLVWIVPRMLQGPVRGWMIWLVIVALGLLWASARALWVRLDGPRGIEITAKEAPELFDALERIRRKIKGPPLHGVYLNDEFNASIQQLPRYGLLGGARNYLSIGLPLLMALDRPRFLAVLAHEYGHLRGDHGRFAAWIYRTRLSWMRLHSSMRHDDGVAAAATQAFMRWYFPRFSARSFALARQDEYEADRIAGKLVGREVVAAALAEIEVRGEWLHAQFWGRHWCAAATHEQPLGPYRGMRRLLADPPEPTFANDAFRQAMRRISQTDDTHPGLRDRVEALDVPATLPDWSKGNALALLGKSARGWIKHFDEQWCRDNASDWKLHYAWLGRVRERAQALTAAMGRNSADELVELAKLRRHLDPDCDVGPLYELALERSNEHAGALRGLVECMPAEDRDGKIALLHRLWEAGPADRWWTARTALAELETPRLGFDHDAAAFKKWRKRLDRAQEAEERAWDEMVNTPYFNHIARHDLSPFELAEVQAELSRCNPVMRAWLVCKRLKEFPQRRAYLVFVELPGLDDEDRYDLCRSLERSLSLPGPVLVLWAGESPSIEDIRRHASEPVLAR